MAAAMTSAARVSLSSPSSAVKAASARDCAEKLRRCAAKLRFPAPSLVGLSSRAALRSAGKISSGRRVDAAMVSAAVDLEARRPEVETGIDEALDTCITETYLNDTIPSLGPKMRGKVRDVYKAGDFMVLVTTDRQSAFDRVLASVPFKGQVLNQTSVWWFDNTKLITENAIVSAPDPNVTIARKCTVFPVESVVRGFVTGSTNTSLWTVYNNGVRSYCGNELAEGMKKNEKLKANTKTPTTKAAYHDLPISGDEIIEQELMSKEDYEEVKDKAHALFKFGQVHTPDSSRYWIASSYEERQSQGLEPENIDKESLRLRFKSKCDPYNDKVLPEAPKELVAELSWRYIVLYETITGNTFMLPSLKEPLHDRIARNVQDSLQRLL